MDNNDRKPQRCVQMQVNDEYGYNNLYFGPLYLMFVLRMGNTDPEPQNYFQTLWYNTQNFSM